MTDDQSQLHISAIIEKLSLTYEQRIEAHQKALELFLDLKKAGELATLEELKIIKSQLKK